MMRRTGLLTAIAIMALHEPAQAQAIVPRLSGTRVDTFVAFKLDDRERRKFTVDADPTGKNRADLRSMEMFVVRRRNTVNMLVEFLNPLKHSWTVSQMAAEHESYANARKFIEAAGDLLNTIGAAQQPAASAATAQEQERLKAAVAPTTPPDIFAPDLLDWSLFATQFSGCYADQAGGGAAFVAAVAAADAAFYAAETKPNIPVRPANRFRSALGVAVKGLVDATEMPPFRAAVKAATDTAAQLVELNKGAADAREKVKNLVNQVAWTASDTCQNFGRYTKGVIARFVESTSDLLTKRQTVAADLTTMTADMDKLLKNATASMFHLASVQVPGDSVKTVTVVVKRRKLDESAERLRLVDESADTLSVLFRRQQLLLASFAPGIAYLPGLKYPRFGTDTSGGNTVVVSAGDDPQRLAAVAMLNFVIDWWLPSVAYPVLQLGVGTAKKYPLLIGGLGLAFPTPGFSIAAGAAWHWQEELEGLSIGQQVGGTADIEKALRWKLAPKPALYIGIQRTQ